MLVEMEEETMEGVEATKVVLEVLEVQEDSAAPEMEATQEDLVDSLQHKMEVAILAVVEMVETSEAVVQQLNPSPNSRVLMDHQAKTMARHRQVLPHNSRTVHRGNRITLPNSRTMHHLKTTAHLPNLTANQPQVEPNLPPSMVVEEQVDSEVAEAVAGFLPQVALQLRTHPLVSRTVLHLTVPVAKEDTVVESEEVVVMEVVTKSPVVMGRRSKKVLLDLVSPS